MIHGWGIYEHRFGSARHPPNLCTLHFNEGNNKSRMRLNFHGRNMTMRMLGRALFKELSIKFSCRPTCRQLRARRALTLFEEVPSFREPQGGYCCTKSMAILPYSEKKGSNSWKYLIIEQNVSVMYIDINAISWCLDLKGKFSSGVEGSLASTLNHDFKWKQLSEMILCIFLLMFSKFMWVTLIQKQQKYK